MKHLFFAVLCLLVPAVSPAQSLLVPAASPAQSSTSQSPQKQSIQGKVVDAKTSQPIRKVNVSVSGGDPFSNSSIATAADGSFVFDNLNPGRYAVNLEHSGFVPSISDRRQRTFTLQPGQSLTGLVFKMQAAGVISGKILDPDGDPLANVSVLALPTSSAARDPRRVGQGYGSTNDLGEYRISNLRPGKYLVSGTPQHVQAFTGSPSANKPDERLVYSATYYPGAVDKTQAVPVEVHSGEETVANFGVLPTHAYRIAGTASGVPSGPLVRLMLAGKGIAPGADNQSELREGNRFEFQNVLPGSYTVLVFSVKGLETGQPQAQTFRMAPSVEVENADVDGLQLQVEPNGTVRGIFHLDTGEKFDWTQLNVGLWPVGDGSSDLFSGFALAASPGIAKRPVVNSDGSFELGEIPGGTYQLLISAHSDNLRDYYTKSVTLSGREVADSGFTVNGDISLDVVISPKGAHLDGTVVDDHGRPVPYATVAIVPNSDHRARPDSYQQETTDAQGRFTARGLAPGSYLVLAFDELLEDIRQPEFTKTYASKSEKVDLDSNSQKSVSAKLIPADSDNP